MNWTSRNRTLTILLLSITAAGAASAMDGPQGVSPGSLDRIATMRDGCTTYSWQEVEGASGYELVAYELAEDAVADTGLDPEQVREVLFVRLPGGVTSWTPEVSDCLAPGGRFAWFVRAVFDEATGEATDWSAPLLFAVAGTPSLAEVEQALDVLLRYVEVGGGAEGRARSGPDRREIANLARTAVAKVTSRSVQTGTAAIRGEQPDPSGETYGVVATSASPDGAGVGAANIAGGPDLVLDGSAQGVADAELSEGGIDRPSASPQTFTVDNSGGGGITLQVEGVEVVTTATDQDTVGALSCAANEIAKFISGVWVCAPDVDTNTDTLAALECHEGLIAKRIAGVWVCAPDDDAIGRLSCGRNEIAKWNDLGGVWECASDQNTTYSFGPGLLVDNGQVVIDPAAFRPRLSILDTTSHFNYYNSMAIGSDGLGLISYYDYSYGNLKVAHCENVLCTAATVTFLIGEGNVGKYNSLAIGDDGLGLVSYYDETNGDLKVAHCNNIECTSATHTVLDSAGDVGRYTSVAIGSDGLGLISYQDYGNQDLKVAHCVDTGCTNATISTLDSTGSVGLGTSLAFGARGFIGYVDSTNRDLKVAHCIDVPCTVAIITTIDSASDVTWYTSVAIGADARGLISYYDEDIQGLKVAHCDTATCSSVTISTVYDDVNQAGYFSSIAIGDDGRALISFSATYGRLKLAHCFDDLCSHTTITDSLDFGVELGSTSMVIGSDGLPLISYAKHSEDQFKVAHLPYGY